MKTFLALLIALSSVSAGGKSSEICPPKGFDSVKEFIPGAYVGFQWFTQLQTVNSFQPALSLFCTSAFYSVTNKPDTIKVYNYANNDHVNGPTSSAHLRAVIQDLNHPSKLKVAPEVIPSFLGGLYWVVATSEVNEADGKYDWAVISGGAPTVESNGKCLAGVDRTFGPVFGYGEGLWVFTREQNVEDSLLDYLFNVVEGLGLDGSMLLRVEQEGCLYEDFKK